MLYCYICCGCAQILGLLITYFLLMIQLSPPTGPPQDPGVSAALGNATYFNTTSPSFNAIQCTCTHP